MSTFDYTKIRFQSFIIYRANGKKDNFKDKKADCRQRAKAIASPFNADTQARIKRIILTLHFFRLGHYVDNIK